MCNHFHILLEVTPKPKKVLTDEQLLKRLGALYSKLPWSVRHFKKGI